MGGLSTEVSGYPLHSAQLHFFNQSARAQHVPAPGTLILVSAQGKTGIPQTQARARKDEIPALRFAWPE